MSVKTKKTAATATRNACKLCAPLGATLAFRGVRGAVPFLHGSQGCATYIRRYLISHYKEPVDIASSSFTEEATIFGGGKLLHTGLDNVNRQYKPELIGVATTCLAETIGEDLPYLLGEYRRERDRQGPVLVPVSTPSYVGTHAEGFTATVRALVETLADGGEREDFVNLVPGMVSPADLRHLREILRDFALDGTILPDYSDTLDGRAWEDYRMIPEGGTGIEEIRRMGRAAATVEFGSTAPSSRTAGGFLRDRFEARLFSMPLPIGVRASDRFFKALEEISGGPMPDVHAAERGRLVDAYVDGHKYVSGRRAVVYGEEDLVAALAGFLVEIGVTPVLLATGGESGLLEKALRRDVPDLPEDSILRTAADFMEIEEEARELSPDIVIGNSKGSKLARAVGAPLVRVGFPVHDRVGGARMLHLGYRGTQQLFDRTTNALIEARQEASTVGYFYM